VIKENVVGTGYSR